mmetsp:Transcript_14339/g.21484  ORF Transcript_14339/g.21484 Transcript_14339/m.21484 type:complete len:205 (+) Transcript_14339:314-928(+)
MLTSTVITVRRLSSQLRVTALHCRRKFSQHRGVCILVSSRHVRKNNLSQEHESRQQEEVPVQVSLVYIRGNPLVVGLYIYQQRQRDGQPRSKGVREQIGSLRNRSHLTGGLRVEKLQRGDRSENLSHSYQHKLGYLPEYRHIGHLRDVIAFNAVQGEGPIDNGVTVGMAVCGFIVLVTIIPGLIFMRVIVIDISAWRYVISGAM